jgi:rhodanese-related sulfurtransferase
MHCRVAFAALAIAVILSLGCIVRECAASGYSDVDTEGVKELLSGELHDGLVLLDVRQPDEYEEGHIEGAILIPLGELENRLSEIDRSKAVLVICWSGFRSARAASILVAAGFEDVMNFARGMSSWDGPVVTGESPWPAAKILAATGEVSVLRSSRPDWEPVSELPVFLYGLDAVRTGAESSASLQFADGTTVVLEELSVMEIEEPQGVAVCL